MAKFSELFEPITCTPKRLAPELQVAAAQRAAEINPVNHAPVERLFQLFDVSFALNPQHIAVVTSKYWGAKGVTLGVGFIEKCPADLAARLITHMNAWGDERGGNIKFALSSQSPTVRISRGAGGYWSYLGTDILSIPMNEPTMNLEAFTMQTPESEFRRVVRHEAGHTLGFPHEHMRAELVARIDKQRAIQYFRQTQGWSRTETIQQVLTPLEERSLLGVPGFEHADQESIMCYQLPGSITVDGQPIIGGADINAMDAAFVAKIYPKAVAPTPPPVEPPPVGVGLPIAVTVGGKRYQGVLQEVA